MKLVSTTPNRRLQASNGETYVFNAEGQAVLPDDIALALPKSIFRIVKTLTSQEVAAMGNKQNEEVSDVAPAATQASDDETLSADEEAPASPEDDKSDDTEGARSSQDTSNATEAHEDSSEQKRVRRKR